MSGLEVTGLVLTVLPLVFNGVLALKDGTQELKNYRRTMKDLEIYLRVEIIKLNNTLEKLLSGVSSISQTELDALISGSGWNEFIRGGLTDYLGQNSVELFESHMDTLHRLAHELAADLGLNIDAGFVVFKPSYMCNQHIVIC